MIIDSKVIILANSEAGEGGGRERWGNYLKVNKHMIPIAGTPLIHYIQKQLRLYGFYDIHISCLQKDSHEYIIDNNSWILSPDTSDYINPNHDLIICETLLNKNKPTLILFGDNFYSHTFFERIMEADPSTWWIYGRHGGSEYINKPYGECFGWYIPPKSIKTLLNATIKASSDMIRIHGKTLPGVAIFETYQEAIALCNESNYFSHWISIDDETTDFDFPKEWDFWKKNVLPGIDLLS